MNDREVREFLTIAKYMSITDAARELYVTQPTLSRSLSKLETELGVRLFERNGNRLALTRAGRRLKARFESLEEGFEALRSDARSLVDERPDPFVSGFGVSFYVYAQTFLGTSADLGEGVAFRSISADRDTLRDLLLAGRIDFAVTYGGLGGDRIASREIMREEVVLMASATHPLAARQTVMAADLRGRTVVCLPADDPFRVATDPVLRDCGIDVAFDAGGYPEYFARIRDGAGGSDTLSFASGLGAHIYPEGYVPLRIAGRTPYLMTQLSWLIGGRIDRERPELVDRIALRYRSALGEHPYDLLESLVR